MSRNGSPAPRKAPPWTSHLRQFSRTSLDKLPAESSASPDTISSSSTVRGPPPAKAARLERTCTVTINESFARDEVLMNLDLFEDDIKPGTLMAISVLQDRAGSYASLRKQSSQDPTRDVPQMDGAQCEVDAGRRYLFVVKDMNKDLRARYPSVEIYVAKHIADAFGMKKGATVLLTPVCVGPFSSLSL